MHNPIEPILKRFQTLSAVAAVAAVAYGTTVSLVVAESITDVETVMTGETISGELAGTTLFGENTKQTFFESGGTNYEEGGNLTFGKWRVNGDQYCSQWPPNEAWACYHVKRRVGADRTFYVFVSEGGTRYETWTKPE